jgi:beta-mannosidase
MARAANANMLRVWGGGLREKRSFYEQCDRLGLLVWQEFPFACPNLARYPTDSAFLDLAEQEASAIVQDLRNHPSVVLWCGGNEFGPGKNRPLVARLQKAADNNDGTRKFLPASPAPGDNHNWMVWHHFAPLSAYVNDRTPVVSEFGLQALPDVSSLHAFLPEGAWPPGPAWGYHNAQLSKLKRYARTVGPIATLADFMRASQQAQARGVQIMVEHMRRRKGATSGVLVWQLNEPWPSICWSLIGYDGTPKLAYHTLQHAFKPLLVSVEYPYRRYKPGDTVDLKLWVVCDGEIPPSPQPSPQRGEGHGEGRSVALLHLFLNGNEVHVQTVHLQGDSSTQVSEVTLRLPENGTPWLLRAELRRGRDLLAENDYDLSYFDAKGIPLLHRLLALFGRWLLR